MAAGALILAKHFYVYSTWHRIYALFFITQKRQNVLLHRDEFEATVLVPRTIGCHGFHSAHTKYSIKCYRWEWAV